MTMSDRIADLSVLWKQASVVFPYFDQRSIDWDQAYREFLPRVMEAKTEREFHLLLAEFMNLLGDGHTDYSLPKTLLDETGYLPFALRFIRDSYCIDAAISEYREFVGAQVLSINDVPIMELMEEIKRYSYHVGNYVSRYRLHQILPFFLKPRQNSAETTKGRMLFDLLPDKPDDLVSQVLRLPDAYRPLNQGKLDMRLYDGGILYIKLDNFLYGNAADEVRAAVEATPGITGILFDLRENVGGMTMYAAKIAELLIPGEFHACRKRTRSMMGVKLASASQLLRWSEETMAKQIAAGFVTTEEVEESRRLAGNTHYDEYVDTYGAASHTALYSGPCVILTSRHTVSAAEDFVAMFRTNQRATILGTETCGTTGTPLLQQLSCGGGMRICSVGYRLMDGTEFIGRGIQPDIFCEMSHEDFESGYDSVLQEGLAFLRK